MIDIHEYRDNYEDSCIVFMYSCGYNYNTFWLNKINDCNLPFIFPLNQMSIRSCLFIANALAGHLHTKF